MNSISEGYCVDQTGAGSDWSEPAVSVRPSRLGRQARVLSAGSSRLPSTRGGTAAKPQERRLG
jgi:hypothetical protein